MKKWWIFLVILFAAAILAFFLLIKFQILDIGNSSPGGQNNFVGETTTIMSDDFTAVRPLSWQNMDVAHSNYLYFPPDEDVNSTNAEYISVIVTPLGSINKSIDELIQAGIEQSGQIMPDFELLEDEEINTGKMQARKLNFTGTQEGVKRSFIQVTGIEFSKLYAITYSCSISPANNCNSYDVLDMIVNSMEIKE
ncbi:MAG: hypothetical protein PHH00_02125 [Candidatus Nanoarchaeia archaeon]|nr:hypothetical protein [Candidatus Nanoarchaeia archaeon]